MHKEDPKIYKVGLKLQGDITSNNIFKEMQTKMNSEFNLDVKTLQTPYLNEVNYNEWKESRKSLLAKVNKNIIENQEKTILNINEINKKEHVYKETALFTPKGYNDYLSELIGLSFLIKGYNNHITLKGINLKLKSIQISPKLNGESVLSSKIETIIQLEINYTSFELLQNEFKNEVIYSLAYIIRRYYKTVTTNSEYLYNWFIKRVQQTKMWEKDYNENDLSEDDEEKPNLNVKIITEQKMFLKNKIVTPQLWKKFYYTILAEELENRITDNMKENYPKINDFQYNYKIIALNITKNVLK